MRGGIEFVYCDVLGHHMNWFFIINNNKYCKQGIHNQDKMLFVYNKTSSGPTTSQKKRFKLKIIYDIKSISVAS
mgnify:CR=1 FL=1